MLGFEPPRKAASDGGMERRLVAYHEAGHAVVRWWLGRGFEYISLPERCVKAPEELYILRVECDEFIMVALAGTLAEQHLLDGRDLPHDSANAAAHERARALTYAEPRDGLLLALAERDTRCGLPPDQLVSTLEDLTRQLLNYPAVWCAVQLLAEALLVQDVVSYDEASVTIGRSGLSRGQPPGLGPWLQGRD